jgi:ferredoxin
MTTEELLIIIALPVLTVLLIIILAIKFSRREAQNDEAEEMDSIFPTTSDNADESMLEQPAGVEGQFSVTFAKSGRQSSWNPQIPTLLEFAEAQGISVDSDCREGHCGTCQTLLVSGDVEYHQKPRIKVEQGHCLLCISMPKTDLVLDI